MSTNELYLHINNGGVLFAVEDTEQGPMVRVSASHFGHPTASTGVYVKPDALRALADFFAQQAARTFPPAYCVAAKTPGERGMGTAGAVCATGSVG
jgi:hypothetical protein